MIDQTMTSPSPSTCTAFAGAHKIASGTLAEVAVAVKKFSDKTLETAILIFDDKSCAAIEIDLRGTIDDVLRRLSPPDNAAADATSRAGPGRPRLGVVSREIGLLPRHWEWLALQPGGASVTLRKLVEDAKKSNATKDGVRQSQNAAYKFMAAMAGDLPHFEEALRAFFVPNQALFETLIAGWPEDIRNYALKVGEAALSKKATL